MIGKILKTMRHESGLTQKQISEKTYLGRSTLSDYEREKTDISFENIEKGEVQWIGALTICVNSSFSIYIESVKLIGYYISRWWWNFLDKRNFITF